MSPVEGIGLEHVAAALVLVAIAAAISRVRGVDLERDIGIAVLRSFLQLTAVGFVIRAIFESDSLAFVAALIAAQVVFGAFTARHRARPVPHAF